MLKYLFWLLSFLVPIMFHARGQCLTHLTLTPVHLHRWKWRKKKKGYLIGRDRVILLLVKGGRIKRTLLNRMGGNGLEGNWGKRWVLEIQEEHVTLCNPLVLIAMKFGLILSWMAIFSSCPVAAKLSQGPVPMALRFCLAAEPERHMGGNTGLLGPWGLRSVSAVLTCPGWGQGFWNIVSLVAGISPEM